jgi:hypothetical protein
MASSPDRTLLLTTGAVGASTALLPAVGGYGTILFQIVVLSAWGLVAGLITDSNADLNHGLVWLVALFLNVGLFLVPGCVVWLITRKRWPKAGSAMLVVWCLIYLAALFVLFPATDGP